MKKLLFFVIACVLSGTAAAQRQDEKPMQNPRVIVLEPPRFNIRFHDVVRLNWGPFHYGGYNANFLFLSPPTVEVIPARVSHVRLFPNKADILSQMEKRRFTPRSDVWFSHIQPGNIHIPAKAENGWLRPFILPNKTEWPKPMAPHINLEH
ncbi:MAG: hypothetical protein J6Y91_00490 [Alphaproteobacteria bacterium]|nr:hypothetical protein [Alphaproteobacteria bacterium]